MKAEVKKVFPSLGNEVIIIRNMESKLQESDYNVTDEDRLSYNKEMVKMMSVGGLYELSKFIASRLYEYPTEEVIQNIKLSLMNWY